MSMDRLPIHPLADLFPMLPDDELQALVDDIKQNGLQHPATTLDGLILDGRNRARACKAAGVALRTVPYTGTDPRAFVISSNLHRRHLNESQRAMVAEKLATLERGDNQHASIEATSQADAAEMLNVSRSAVQRAAVVREHGTPELITAVENGDIAVSVAADLAELPAEEQKEAIKQPKKAKHAAKAHKRKKREKALAEKTKQAEASLSSGKLYNVIYADPPWRFEPYSRDTGMDRAADNHYPTMALDALKALRVPAAPDCELFIWATAPMLPQALEVVAAWGFTYKSHCVWVKKANGERGLHYGTGYWFRNAHELLIVATRGGVLPPPPDEILPSVIELPVGKHSEKPNFFHTQISGWYPHLAKLEMFARPFDEEWLKTNYDGWDRWGNEA
jgi:N6-adenosine-specific RNA methylase IME4/predicted transcriptional regulator